MADTEHWRRDLCKVKKQDSKKCTFEDAFARETSAPDWRNLDPMVDSSNASANRHKALQVDCLAPTLHHEIGLPCEFGLLHPTPYHAALHLPASPGHSITLLECIVACDQMPRTRGWKDNDLTRTKKQAEPIYLPESLPDVSAPGIREFIEMQDGGDRDSDEGKST